MDLSHFRPEAKSVIIQERAKKTEERQLLNRSQRYEIDLRLREKRSQSMMAKQRRFEWRARIPVRLIQEVKRIGVNWQALFIVMGSARLLKFITVQRKLSKDKADLHLSAFVIAVRVVGKFKRVLTRARVNRAMRTMKRMIGPCTLWVRNRRTLLGKKLVQCVEYALTNDMMFKMMAEWRIKVVFRQRLMIQRSCTKYIVVKQARLNVLMTKWSNIELSVRKKKLKSKKKLQANEAIPPTVVYHYAGLYYRECMNLYLRAKEEHDSICKEIDAANKERSYELAIHLVGTTPLQYPKAPTLRLLTNQRLFEHFIFKARDDKPIWGKLVHRKSRRASILNDLKL